MSASNVRSGVGEGLAEEVEDSAVVAAVAGVVVVAADLLWDGS